jgi:hypothetical protein
VSRRTVAGELGAVLAVRELVEFPEPLADALALLDRVEGEMHAADRRAAATKAAARRSAGTRIVSGVGAEEAHASAVADREAYGDALAAHEQASQALLSARGLARKAVAANRDAIIMALRERVDVIVAEAEPLAKKLEGFAPPFEPTTILRDGKPAEHAAYQKALPLDAEFQQLVTTWVAIWGAGTGRAASPGTWPRDWRPEHPGGLHVWSTPMDVADDRVRDGLDHQLLSVARWHSVGGYRLATGGEFRCIAEGPIELSWPSDEHRHRGVWLPAQVPEARRPLVRAERTGRAAFF